MVRVVNQPATVLGDELTCHRDDVAGLNRYARGETDIVNDLETQPVFRHDGEAFVPRMGVAAEKDVGLFRYGAGHHNVGHAVRSGGS